ncbi:hypothetical protein CLOM_g5147 [Closterium sp. NIES-68]|nr:hypothetical protein CLOM_g5147 [Closterium sp. NIES-68]
MNGAAGVTTVGMGGNNHCYDVNGVGVNGVGSGSEGFVAMAPVPVPAAAALVLEVREIANNQRRLGSEIDSLSRLLRDSLDSDTPSSARHRSSHRPYSSLPHHSHYSSLSDSPTSDWSVSRVATVALPAIAACAVGLGLAVLVRAKRSN